MTFKEYQEQVKTTTKYPMIQAVFEPDEGIDDLGNTYSVSTIKDINFIYSAMGLSGEIGNINEILERYVYGKDKNISEEHKQDLSDRIGNILWHLSELSSSLNMSLEDIAENNIKRK